MSESDVDRSSEGVRLLSAVKGREQWFVAIALDRGADVDFCSPEEPRETATPLRAACAAANPQLIRILLEHGARVFANFEVDRWTALHSAAAHGHDDIVRLLLAEAEELQRGDWLDGFSLPHVLVECLSTQLFDDGLDILAGALKASAEPDASSQRLGYADWTPFHAACARGSKQAAALALRAGAELHARTGDFYVGSRGVVAFAEGVPSAGPCVASVEPGVEGLGPQWLDKGLLAIHLAALGGHLSVVNFLLRRGQALNATTSRHRWTPLMFAVVSGSEPLVREILRSRGRAVANAMDRRGDGTEWTPLALAVSHAGVGVVRALVEYGADPLRRLSMADFPGSAFVRACEGAPNCWSGPDGRVSLLHLAVMRGNAELVRAVLGLMRAAHAARMRSDAGQAPASEGPDSDPVTFSTTDGWLPAVLGALLHAVDPGASICGVQLLELLDDPLREGASREEVFLELMACRRALLEDRPSAPPLIFPHRFPDVAEDVVVHAADEFARLCAQLGAERAASRMLHNTLCLACRLNRLHLVGYLLESGLCDPCCRFIRPIECRPLHVAASCGFGSLAQLLIEHRADPLERDEHGACPILKLSQFHDHQVCELQGRVALLEAHLQLPATPSSGIGVA